MAKEVTALFLFLTLLISFNQVCYSQRLSPEDFSMHGDTYLTSEQCFRLTEAEDYASGSIWFRRPISLLKKYSVELTIVLGCNDDLGADGMVFVMTSQPNRTGWRGEGMGFAGLNPSLGVEIDTYENYRLNDPEEDHLAILVNGRVGHYFAETQPVTIPNIEDCSRHKLGIYWDPVLQKLSVEIDRQEIVAFRWNIIQDIFEGNDIIHWGITAGTGRKNNIHEVCFDHYAYLPIDAPDQILKSPIEFNGRDQ